jgi:hypothetical protein
VCTAYDQRNYGVHALAVRLNDEGGNSGRDACDPAVWD